MCMCGKHNLQLHRWFPVDQDCFAGGLILKHTGNRHWGHQCQELEKAVTKFEPGLQEKMNKRFPLKPKISVNTIGVQESKKAK